MRSILRLFASASLAQTVFGAAICNSTFETIDAWKYTAALHPGWNLGNTLDAVPDEGSWNNPKAQPETFDLVKGAGFKSVRVPVTYTDHFVSEGPDWEVDPVWLQRVSDVLDMVTSRGLIALVNVHHDSWGWMDITKGVDPETIYPKFHKLWYQIGLKLACKSHLVAFEPINEAPGETAEHGAVINKYNQIFLQAIADAGGHNRKRFVTLVGAGEDSIKTSLWFEKPEGIENPWALQFHYYSPYDFIFGAWGKTTWGSEADKAAMETDFVNLRANFTDVPLVLGEWSGNTQIAEPAARWSYWNNLAVTAKKYDISWIIWDNGLDFLDRSTGKWRDETALEVLQAVIKGETNTLPRATVDSGSLTSQTSSATLTQRVGRDWIIYVEDKVLPFALSGNTISSISSSSRGELRPAKDFVVGDEKITFKASFLWSYFSDNEPGVKDVLIITPSSGAKLRVQVLAWSPPTLSASTSKATPSDGDLSIPITYAGLHKLAAVKASFADGTYLFDDWTRWLPVLQQGRMTYNSHWEWAEDSVVLRKAVVDEVLKMGKPVQFMFEFWPRVPENVANYTLTG